MRVYKFGGASVRSAEGVANLCRIVREETGPLFVIVSAMGKTTNALEEVLESFMKNDSEAALERFVRVETYHNEIIRGLFADPGVVMPSVETWYAEVRNLLTTSASRNDYDRWYDRIVGYGELLSTTIVSVYLTSCGVPNCWVDMRQCFVTDSRFREANINVDRSSVCLHSMVNESQERLFIGQGFIGATASGQPTTLGREGSDYSAAMAGNILNARSVTIWKDVDGVLNADPRLFDNTTLISQLTYLDAIELAYSGAQIIHPKTIKPLQNKAIPLYVRPFSDPAKPGTVICEEISEGIHVPIFILKRNQVLVSIRPKDFSFVLEERLADIFRVFGQYRQKINLIQSSAVNLSLCIDDSRYLERVVDTLQVDFRVVYNKEVELLTVRGYDATVYAKYANGDGIYLVQKTRRTVRIVRHGMATEKTL